jgi:uncharacterized protein YqeY
VSPESPAKQEKSHDMSLEHTVNTGIKAAMLARDETTLRALRAIKAAILLAKTSEGATSEMTAEDEVRMLQKMVKQRKDSLEIFTAQKRDDLAQREREEIEVIERFLPARMTPEELREEIGRIIQETGAVSLKDLGKVMGVATRRLSGKADGKEVSDMAKSLLAG